MIGGGLTHLVEWWAHRNDPNVLFIFYDDLVRPPLRVRSHCRFRNNGTDYVRESGMKWMSVSTKATMRPIPTSPLHAPWLNHIGAKQNSLCFAPMIVVVVMALKGPWLAPRLRGGPRSVSATVVAARWRRRRRIRRRCGGWRPSWVTTPPRDSDPRELFLGLLKYLLL
jgi:hypothetical protein